MEKVRTKLLSRVRAPSARYNPYPIPQQQKGATLLVKRNSSLIRQQPTTAKVFPGGPSSLVRRARVIRRRTTNVYCDTLRRLKDEDTVLIRQILLISLKHRSEATEYECSCVGPCSSPTIPSVDFAYPPMGSNATHFPPTLFYPDFMKGTVQRREQSEAFQVVLTNEKGERTFAFCLKFPVNYCCSFSNRKHCSLLSVDSGIGSTLPSTPPHSVLVFLSPLRVNEQLFHELASDFVAMLHRDSSKRETMCRDLTQLRLTTSETSIKHSKYVVGGTKYANEWARNNVSTVIEKIGVENAVLVFLSMLSERRIIVTGSNVSDMSEAVQAFIRLLAPLEWPHTLIPIVPDSQTELCFNPTPYICGVLRYNLSRISELICPRECSVGDLLVDDITVFDVERGMIVPPICRSDNRIGLAGMLRHTATMGFPNAAVCEIISAFKGCMPVRDAEKADYKIQKQVMIWYAKLFGHYRKYGQSILTARNRKLFAHAHPCAETRLFLKWFVENGILQSFIFTQTQDTCSSASSSSNSVATCGLFHRFQKILKKYAPPVDREGNRRRTKSLLWKVFTL